MFITNEEKEQLQQAILLLQKIYYQLDQSEQEERFLARANKIIMDQTGPSRNDGLFCANVIEFTEKEIVKMPREYRRDFRAGKFTAHVRKKSNGVYEIRCQIDGRQISASSKNLETAKALFIKKLHDKKQPHSNEQPPVAVIEQQAAPEAQPVTLAEYMRKWLEIVKKPTIKENSYQLYLNHYKRNICPVLGDRDITKIKPFELQEFINNLVEQGKVPTAKKCRILLKAMYEYAVIDDIVPKSPMLKVVLPHYEAKEGVPFTREEEKRLVKRLKNGGDIYVQAYVFMLYTGLRRSELASIEIKDGFVNLISAKGRKGYKEKQRSVPISPMLTAVLPYIDIDGIRSVSMKTLTTYASDYLKPHHTHELRHTFITRCQECGIRREIVSLWAGHTADSSITTTVYTHLEYNKDIQIEEIKKFNYKL